MNTLSNDRLTCALQHTAPIIFRYEFVVWRGILIKPARVL